MTATDRSPSLPGTPPLPVAPPEPAGASLRTGEPLLEVSELLRRLRRRA